MTRKRRDLDLVKDALAMLRAASRHTGCLLAPPIAKLDEYLLIQESRFSQWLRDEPALASRAARLSVMDIDWLIHNYLDTEDTNGKRKVENLMIIEEKRRSASLDYAQQDTFASLAALMMGGKTNMRTAYMTKQSRRVQLRFFGCHTLTFSGDGPTDSDCIHWNDRVINLELLKDLLRFERNPWTMGTRNDRRHHRNIKQENLPFFENQN